MTTETKNKRLGEGQRNISEREKMSGRKEKYQGRWKNVRLEEMMKRRKKSEKGRIETDMIRKQ